MDKDLRPGNNRTLLIGLSTLVVFVLVAITADLLLDVDGISTPDATLGEDPAESFSRLKHSPLSRGAASPVPRATRRGWCSWGCFPPGWTRARAWP